MEYAYIRASNNSTIVSKIDIEDILFSIYNWTYDYSNGYLLRMEKKKKIYLHREIIMAKLSVDHINGDKLDNRKANLRECLNKDNVKNRKSTNKNKTSSKYKGVYFSKRSKNWYVKIMFNRKHYHIGCFSSETDSAKAYDKAAKQYFGKFANPNFKDT